MSQGLSAAAAASLCRCPILTQAESKASSWTMDGSGSKHTECFPACGLLRGITKAFHAFGSRLAWGTGSDLRLLLGPGPFWIGFNVFQTRAPPSWLCTEFLAHSPNILTGIQYCYCTVPLSEGFSAVMQHQHGVTGFKKNPKHRFFSGHVLGRAFVKSVSPRKSIWKHYSATNIISVERTVAFQTTCINNALQLKFLNGCIQQ